MEISYSMKASQDRVDYYEFIEISFLNRSRCLHVHTASLTFLTRRSYFV